MSMGARSPGRGGGAELLDLGLQLGDASQPVIEAREEARGRVGRLRVDVRIPRLEVGADAIQLQRIDEAIPRMDAMYRLYEQY